MNGALINNLTLCDSTQSAQNLEWDNRFLILCNISPSSVMPRIYNECHCNEIFMCLFTFVEKGEEYEFTYLR